MFSRKKPKRVSFADAADPAARIAKPDFSAVTDGGPARPVSFAHSNGNRGMSAEEMWLRLGDKAWDLLKRKRADQILPTDLKSEFRWILELRRRSTRKQTNEVFIGLRHPGIDPLFVPREVFQRHGYILGASGFGKTSHALGQLLIQLAEPYAWNGGGRRPTGVMIIDMKPGGDPFLRALAEQVAEEQERTFRFFSSDPTFQSVQFDPFAMLRATPYLVERAEMLIKAFSLVYAEGYGSDFFTAEQRTLLTEIIHEDKPDTFQKLINMVAHRTSGDKGNKDARGLYSAISGLQYALHVNVDSSPVDPEDQIDFDRFLEEGEILYVHLDSRGTYLLGRDIGKLMLFSLLKAATERLKRRQTRQAFVLIDEFQRLAARNVVEMLEDARSSGIGFVLAHQSSSALKTRDTDLYGTLFENCSFKQCLTLEDARVVDLFRLISGRVMETKKGGATTEGEAHEHGSSYTSGKSSSWSSGSGTSGLIGSMAAEWSKSESRGETTSHGSGTSEGHTKSKSTTSSWQDELVARLTPEMIVDVNNMELLSLVHVKGENKGATPTDGVPVLVQGLYPVRKSEYETMSLLPWPARTRSEAEWLERARPSIGRETVEQVAGAASHSAQPSRRKREGASREKRNELQQRLAPLYERLRDGMLGEFVSVEALSRRYGVPVERILELASVLNHPVSGAGDLLRPDHAAEIERLLRSV
ncbi:MAG: TraM recognition domain-containing protein [Phycisphaerae bacterium]